MKTFKGVLSVYGRSLCFARTMCQTRNVSVGVNEGTVVGQQLKLLNGEPYYTFKGIPYAVPPVGDLRFKPPVPLQRFETDILDCTQERSTSFHKNPMTNEITGSENCLFLNVYTPKLDSSKQLPVMVWIHGGAFMLGSGNSDFHFPLTLMEEDVIVVTLNYRLGMFGFLHLPDAGIPGNAGLKDQLLALKWVKENIHNFGGDSNNITLFGHSAGAASVHLHVLSENSKKYFHKAILQSGTANMEWVLQRNSIDKTRKLAEVMGCTSKSDKEILEFLLNVEETVDIYKHMLAVLSPDERRRGLPIPFKPVVEESSDNAIVDQAPFDTYMTEGKVDVPLMMGYTSSEGITMLANAVRKLDVFEKDLARLIPKSINLDPSDPRCLELAKDIRNFYFDGQAITEKNLDSFCQLLTDYHFNIGIHLAAETHARKQKTPLYFYRFSYDGKMNLFKKWFSLQHIKGACHGDELFYLFQMSFMEKQPKPSSNEGKMTKNMCRMWTNFAKYGNPTPNEDNTLDFKWLPVKRINENDEFTLDYLEIGEEIEMGKNPDKNRIDYWRDIYQKFNQSFCNPKL